LAQKYFSNVLYGNRQCPCHAAMHSLSSLSLRSTQHQPPLQKAIMAEKSSHSKWREKLSLLSKKTKSDPSSRSATTVLAPQPVPLGASSASSLPQAPTPKPQNQPGSEAKILEEPKRVGGSCILSPRWREINSLTWSMTSRPSPPSTTAQAPLHQPYSHKIAERTSTVY
jgi:hypothetical protein